MQITKLSQLYLMFLMLVIMASFVHAIPLTVDSVDIGGVILTNSTTNPLNVQRGQNLDISVRLTGTDSAKNVEVEAFISGFEYSDVQKVSDNTGLFDVLPNVTYVKQLSVPLPIDLAQDNYKLRILVTDRDNNELVQNYDLMIDVPRHLVAVKDIILTPENEIAAGGVLLAAVRVENQGASNEKDIKVNVAIPALGVSATKYIDQINTNDEAQSEEVYLRLPDCAPEGRYDVLTNVYYSDNYRTVTGNSSILVTKNDLCENSDVSSAAQPPSKIVINVSSNFASITPGNNAVFPITISNNARTSKSFSVVPSLVNWADLTVSPTTTDVLASGKSETFYVSATPNDNAVGSQIFTVSVSSSNEVLKQIPITVKVVESLAEQNAGGIGLKHVLEVGLIVLLVLLIIVGLIVGFSLLHEENEPPEQLEPEPYY